jgi:Alginate lyase/F5/8 type C domain
MKKIKFQRSFIASLFCIVLLISIASCTKKVIEPAAQELPGVAVNPLPNNPAAKSSSSVEMAITGISASATYSSSYPASNATDGNLSTRWTASGTVYLYADLGAAQLIDYVKIAHHSGTSRTYTMQMHVRNSTTASWTLVGTKTSPGNTNSLVDYDLVNSTNRYIRITCTGNSSNEFSDITELEVWGTPSTTGGGGGGTTSAQAILGGLANWKLNAYSGTFNLSASNNGLTYVDNASKADNANWFYDANGYAYFKTYPGNPRSGGSSNPRTELREMNANGSNEYNWDGTGSTEHKMKWKVRVDNLPPSGKLCFGQIHSTSGTYDDLIRVQVQGTGGQSSGEVTLRILGYATETLLGEGVSISSFNFNMDTEYYFELTMQNRVIKLYALNSSGARTSTLFTSGSISSSSNYFKAGCYLQSTSSSDYGSSVFGLVGINYITTSH